MSKRKKSNRCVAVKVHQEVRTSEIDQYAYRSLNKRIDFELERKAIQEVLDAVVRLQTYIAMREAREGGGV